MCVNSVCFLLSVRDVHNIWHLSIYALNNPSDGWVIHPLINFFIVRKSQVSRKTVRSMAIYWTPARSRIIRFCLLSLLDCHAERLLNLTNVRLFFKAYAQLHNCLRHYSVVCFGIETSWVSVWDKLKWTVKCECNLILVCSAADGMRQFTKIKRMLSLLWKLMYLTSFISTSNYNTTVSEKNTTQNRHWSQLFNCTGNRES